jgi:ABC-type multidrug transport system ATPase subunit
MNYIEAKGLRKTYGGTAALDGIDLHIGEGRIVGIIGPNGAGKTTALNATWVSRRRRTRVLGRDPWNERDALMRDVCFITDVAVLFDGFASRRRSISSPPSSQVRSREGEVFRDHDPAVCTSVSSRKAW